MTKYGQTVKGFKVQQAYVVPPELSWVLSVATDPCQEVALQATSPTRKLRPLGWVHKDVITINHLHRETVCTSVLRFLYQEYLIRGRDYSWCRVAGIVQ